MNGQDAHKADNARRTPLWLVESARQLMGRIDLDPASDAQAEVTVRAGNWYGSVITPFRVGWLGFDGLTPEWHGRVWLNPPGGKLHPKTLQPIQGGPGVSSTAVWWNKLLIEYLSGRVEQACFLAFSLNVFRTGQGLVSPYEFPFLVFKERLRFASSNGSTTEAPNVDSALIYLPRHRDVTQQDCERFKSIFSKYGKVRI